MSAPRSTEWFKESGFGIFVHYLNELQNKEDALQSLGMSTPWNEAVQAFDVDKFADQIAQTEAGYVIFTMHQMSPFLIAPNETYSRFTGYPTGTAASSRDLVEDLYRALHLKGIKLMLYWTGDGPRQDPQASIGLGLDGAKTNQDMKINPVFIDRWSSVAKEYSIRYGEKVWGWWVDGCYSWIGYTEEELEILANALRSGNPNSIVALNMGVEKKVTAYSKSDDYTCGEMREFEDIPDTRFIEGKQWHILSFLGENWAKPGAKYTTSELLDYIRKVTTVGGVVSIDVCLYRDGTIDPVQLEQLRAIRLAQGKG